MFSTRWVIAAWCFALSWGLAASSFAAGYENLEQKKGLSLVGDFAGLNHCTVEGKYQITTHDRRSALRADSEVHISAQPSIVAPYSLRAWVRLAAKRSPVAKAVLTAAENGKGGYRVELASAGDAIDIRAWANGCNLWAGSTYKFGEAPGTDYLRYHLKLNPKELQTKLEHMEDGLRGIVQQWSGWGLGSRGEVFEARQVQGLKDVMRVNEAEPAAAERFTQVAIDVADDVVRMWVDGRLVGEVQDPPSVTGEISLLLPAGAMLESLETVARSPALEGFVCLDLAGYHNRASGLGGKWPTGLLRIEGIPLLLGKGAEGKDEIDVGRSAPLETGFGRGFLESPFAAASALIRHPSRIVLQVPKGWYQQLYLLAFAEREPDTEPIVSFRFFRSERTGTVVDYACKVPYGDQPGTGESVASLPWAGPEGKQRYLHVVRVPLEPALMQSWLEKSCFRDLCIEITKGLSFTRGYPDPGDYNSLAGGRKSSVHILGLTFQESPLQMVVGGDEVGHFFVEPERPHVQVSVRNVRAAAQRATLEIAIADSYGAKQKIDDGLEIAPRSALLKRYPLRLQKYGLLRLNVVLSGSDGKLTKETTLGYLPRDTRQAGFKDSFFGVWNWGLGAGGYGYPIQPEETMQLVAKLGARWTLSIDVPAIAKHYGITKSWAFLPSIPFDKVPRENWESQLKRQMVEGLLKQRAACPDQDLYLLFGEANLGREQTFALPGRYYGEPDYRLNEIEQQKFDRLFERAVLTGKVLKTVKQEYPEFARCKVAFGNTSPSFHIEFMKRGLPRECIDAFGIDIPYFERMPERQPRAVEASQLLYLYDFRKQFGCEDIPIYGTEDMFYPGCPGSLSQREQADYYVRCHLLKLALGVSREASVAMVFSTSGPYGRTHYGSTGLFEVSPEGGGDGNPREAAVAYATMTRVLDGPKFEKYFSTGSLSTFCLALSRKYLKGEAFALWTLHGKRELALTLADDATVQVTDAMGNRRPAASVKKKLKVEVGSSPVWIEGLRAKQVRGVQAAEPQYDSKPDKSARLLGRFDAPWRMLTERDTSYEENNFDLPRFPAAMTATLVPGLDGGRVLKISLPAPQKERKLAPWYAAFVPPQPIALPGKPTKLGLYVKGNSGWGRVIPQLTDAKGKVWTFIGAKDAWNSDDIRSQSSINFDGWKVLEMELPGNLPNGWPGPTLGFWKCEKGDRIVDYPLRLTKLIVEQRTHIYYVNEVVPVPDLTIVLDKLFCSYEDPYEQLRLSKGW